MRQLQVDTSVTKTVHVVHGSAHPLEGTSMNTKDRRIDHDVSAASIRPSRTSSTLTAVS